MALCPRNWLRTLPAGFLLPGLAQPGMVQMPRAPGEIRRGAEAVPGTNNDGIPKCRLVRDRVRITPVALLRAVKRYQRKTKEAVQRREGVCIWACWGPKASELGVLKMGELHVSRAGSGQNWAAGGSLSPRAWPTPSCLSAHLPLLLLRLLKPTPAPSAEETPRRAARV